MVFIASFLGGSDTHRFVIHKFVHFCDRVGDHCPLACELAKKREILCPKLPGDLPNDRVCGFPTLRLGAIAICRSLQPKERRHHKLCECATGNNRRPSEGHAAVVELARLENKVGEISSCLHWIPELLQIENAPVASRLILKDWARQLIQDARLPKTLHKKQAFH